MCDHKPSWTGPWMSDTGVYKVERPEDDLFGDVELEEEKVCIFLRHCHCDICPDFWTELKNAEEWWEIGLRYKDLPN